MLDHAVAVAIFQDLVDPELARAGFARRRPLEWVRRSVDSHDLIEITHLKAASYSVAWGVSLDFVPHEQSGELKWHRTAKSARMDLRFDFWDLEEDDSRLVCRLGDDPDAFRAIAADLASRAIHCAHAWLEFRRDVPGLLAKFESERARTRHGWMGFDNWIQQPLAYACVLARAGRPDDAARALAAWGIDECSRQLQARLTRHLESLAPSPATRSASPARAR